MFLFSSIRPLRPLAALALLGAATLFPLSAPVQGQAVLTQNGDNARTGANRQELVLTPANVNADKFGKLFTRTLDADVNGQVLYVPQVKFKFAARNMIYAYTSNNSDHSPCSLYAFDADDATTSAPLWHTTLPNSATYTTPTPVIDYDTGTMYVLTKTDNDDTGATYLHAVSITTGLERPGSPVHVQASAPGTGDGAVNGVVSFDGPASSGNRFHANDRDALLLLHGVVYMGFAHNSDSFPYHGWLLGYHYDGAQFTQTAKFCTTPNGSDGGIWQAGKGLTADADGYIYCTVGNGTFDIPSRGKDYGMCVLKLTPDLHVASWFAPFDELAQSNQDLDLGNVGVTLIPGTDRLFTGATKFGTGFVLDMTSLGGFTPNGPDAIVQRLDGLTPNDSVGQNAVCWDAGSSKFLYLWANGANLQQFLYDPAAGKLSPAGPYKEVSDSTGGSLVVSANGTKNGILWAVDGNAVIHAYDASYVSRPELWNSSQNSDRDSLPSVGHFQFPTVINGKVYVPTHDHSIVVYGLLPPSSAATKTHFLWDNVNGQVSLWTRDNATGSVTSQVYGPDTGFTARAVADGPDGATHLLWTNTNGQISLWRLSSTGSVTTQEYGPFTNFNAVGLSVGPDNTVHVLWNKTDGTASLWRVNAQGAYTHTEYGPYSGWTAHAVADGPDGQTRILWDSTNGAASLWSVPPGGLYATQTTYGPYSGWIAGALAVGPDNQTRIVWNNTTGAASLWSIDGAGNARALQYGPYNGWSAVGVALDTNAVPRLLWDKTDGMASLWSRDDTGPFTSTQYGPYTGYTAVGISATP